MPRIAPLRKMFSRPDNSGWKPVPTSSSDPTFPRTRLRPSVGSVIRERIFSRVLFPAPLRPTIPNVAPRARRGHVTQRPHLAALVGRRTPRSLRPKPCANASRRLSGRDGARRAGSACRRPASRSRCRYATSDHVGQTALVSRKGAQSRQTASRPVERLAPGRTGWAAASRAGPSGALRAGPPWD